MPKCTRGSYCATGGDQPLEAFKKPNKDPETDRYKTCISCRTRHSEAIAKNRVKREAKTAEKLKRTEQSKRPVWESLDDRGRVNFARWAQRITGLKHQPGG